MTYMEVGNSELIWLADFRSRVTSVLPVTRSSDSQTEKIHPSQDTKCLFRQLLTLGSVTGGGLVRGMLWVGSALLELAISHELGHALCHEPDEYRADDYGRELRGGRILSCSPSPGLSATHAAKTTR